MNGSLIINDWFTFWEIKQSQVSLHEVKHQKLNIYCKDYLAKKHNCVYYLSCLLEKNLNWESVARKIYKKVLCNALIQPDFDFSCIAWYPLISKEKTVSQSSKISACYTRILAAHIKEINLLPVELRVELGTVTTVLNIGIS